ncbi:MAG: septation protein SpoVG family protein [Candidatus Riflebacteria bacterium]|nr:septation protein SpoVG family protein [Candidatus Riflebacteria bacterium]
MRITAIKIFPLKIPRGKVRAFASIILDDFIMIRDFKVIEGRKGVFVGFPTRKITDGVFREIIQPVDSIADQTIKEAIIRAYEDEMARPENSLEKKI